MKQSNAKQEELPDDFYPGKEYQNLFNYVSRELNVSLLQSEMQEIISIVNKDFPQSTSEAEGQQQGEGDYIKNLEEKVEQRNRRILEFISFLKAHEQWEADFISDNSQWWPHVEKDTLRGKLYESFIELQSRRNALLSVVMQTNGASQEKFNSNSFADTINFLEKIDSSSMSDKTWLAEQKNLRQEGKELRERLTGKEIEEVKIKKVK